jgi:hypothetical protein
MRGLKPLLPRQAGRKGDLQHAVVGRESGPKALPGRPIKKFNLMLFLVMRCDQY